MKIFNIKVSNPSKYWTTFEGELSTHYHIKWSGENSVYKFITNEVFFFQRYVSLCNKYGLVIPLNCDEENLVKLYEDEKKRNKANGISAWYFMFYLYKLGESLIYPSKLFVDLNDESPKKIVNIDPLRELKDIEATQNFFSAPLKVELREKDNEIKLHCYLDNDAFNFWIDNKKTKRDPEIGGKGLWVDNSDLAYLNTPRLNSFLRDLKKLCFEYGATEFEFENLGLQNFSENGVLFDNEIVYYEDVYEMLPSKNQIVEL